jgi:multidrug efflux pump subunit AcrA (membrane-fusion protein)
MSRYSKNKSLILIIAVACLAAILYFALRSKPGGGGESAQIGKVTRGELIQRVTIAGTAEPVRSTIVAAPYDGYVKKIFVKLGDHVASGDPLVSIAQSLQSAESVFPVRAPFAGLVTQVLKTEGQFVKTGDTKDFVLRIDDMSRMFIQSNVPEIDVVKIKSGLDAVVKVSAILSRTYKGVVRDIALASSTKEQWGQRSQVDYQMKIEITNVDAQLKPGMTAIVDIITNKIENALMLPHEFIYKEGEKYYVVMKDGNHRDIKVGAQNEMDFEILSGLREGEEVRQVDFAKLNATE